MKQQLLVSSILMGLAATLWLSPARAQTTPDTADDQAKKSDAQKLDVVPVTGSLIPQAQVETASPTITITSQQLERQGFGSVYDALRAQPVATGAVQDNQFTGGFTPGATTISLLGLDPGFTLYLINGHPLADYPLLYNGASNFVDLSDIPVGMVDRIDILPGNQSSIYGSSAIAGVINIILKDKIDGYELNVRGGGYSHGGGANERVEFLGGHSWGDLDVTFGLQYSNQQPIWGYSRDITASRLENPDPALRYGARTILHYYLDANNGYATTYYDPGSSTCAGLSNLYGGTTDYEYRPGRGYYCGTKNDIGYSTIKNQDHAGTGYLNVKYKLNDSAELYGNVLYNVSSISFSSGPYFWETNINGGGLFFNQDTGNFEGFQHIYAPEEIGNSSLYSERQLERSYNAWGGVRGTVGTNNNWDYDAFYARSQTNLSDKNYWPLGNAVENFFQNQFLGPQHGTTSGYPIYSPNVANFYKAITPAQYASFIGLIDTKSSTWTQNVNLTVNNTDLFELPAGPAGFGGLIQIGNQSWQNPTDPRVINGDFYGLTGTSGGGIRDNWAMAAELRAPIVSTLVADASVRYDQYSNQGGGGDDKVTYKLGLEFRPIDTLLLRGNYATAFRAPDMAYTFGGKSGFYQPGVTDYYRCDVTQPPGTPLTNCPYYQSQDPFGVHEGNFKLQSITAKSYGFGAVWSPTSDFNIKADYYNIKISNEVQIQSIDLLLKTEADCYNGQLDINSPTCVATLSQIQRAPGTGPNAYALQQITVFPINIANEHVSGILASLAYRYDLGSWGDLGFTAQYNVTLTHEFQQSAGDQTVNLLTQPNVSPFSTEFKTIANGSITWNIDKFSTTVYGTRYGKTPNLAAQLNGYGTVVNGEVAGTVAPWMLYNASVSYAVTDDIKVSGLVNNIKNSKPPVDSTYNSLPYYNFLNYNPYGRQFWLEIDWRFGKSGK